MKYLLLLILPIFLIAYSATAHTVPDTIVIDNTPLTYYYIKTTKEQKNGLIIYMHGGVSQFKGKTTPVDISPIELLEGNEVFLPAVNNASYDIILPVAYNEYNWLEKAGEDFIMQLVTIHGSRYKRTYISGFSDGGTGAFRFFYNNPPSTFAGMMVFNGYPQLENYYKKVDHSNGIGKNIIYLSTKSDKIIPYEFLLIEYRRQKILNEHTYFILRDGSHSFKEYGDADFKLCLNLLSKTSTQIEDPRYIWIYPPIDGLVIDNEIKELYVFRKKTGKNYSMAKTEYDMSDIDTKAYSKLLSDKITIRIEPIETTGGKLESDSKLYFPVTIEGERNPVSITNWLATPTW